MRILAAEDDPEVRELLTEKFSGAGDQVLAAGDGMEALELARKELPDLILLDVMMPGMNGHEVCEELRGDPLTRNIPVIMLTAKDALEEKMRGLRAGADFYATKPIDFDWLLAKIRIYRSEFAR